jgi:hypothetical protein
MLVAASVSSFERRPPHLPIQLLDWPRKLPRPQALRGGPSGM